MIDPEELPLEEMSLTKGQASGSRHTWRELTSYMREVHPAFHTTQDYRATLRFFILRYPKLQQNLNDWSNNSTVLFLYAR